MHVEIRVRECLDENWTEWFEGFSISHTGQGESILTGVVPDQAALYGLIAKLRDLGLPLVSLDAQPSNPPAARAAPPAAAAPDTR